MSSDNISLIECRVCTSSDEEQTLVKPCSCNNYVHQECLKEWIKQRTHAENTRCEICQKVYSYTIEKRVYYGPHMPLSVKIKRSMSNIFEKLPYGQMLIDLLALTIYSAMIIGFTYDHQININTGGDMIVVGKTTGSVATITCLVAYIVFRIVYAYEQVNNFYCNGDIIHMFNDNINKMRAIYGLLIFLSQILGITAIAIDEHKFVFNIESYLLGSGIVWSIITAGLILFMVVLPIIAICIAFDMVCSCICRKKTATIDKNNVDNMVFRNV